MCLFSLTIPYKLQDLSNTIVAVNFTKSVWTGALPQQLFSFLKSHKMAGGGKKADDAQASAAAAATGPGFPVGATLVARWMGQVERTCVVIDRSEWLQ